MKTLSELIAERQTLTDALADCERGARPGSKVWMMEKEAMKALSAFDKKHPEVVNALYDMDAAKLKGVDLAGI